jgi:phosphatidylglycerophosphate synthase|nr:CDP-alcohol phosphatidyltransferase family protein [Kofleriaceae bacterium]
MERFLLLAPALILFTTIVVTLVVFAGLSAAGRTPRLSSVKHNQLFGAFFGRYIAWLLGPIERALLGRVSPNAVTTVSLLMCALTGVAAALGKLPAAVWLYAFAGILDVLDGRLARLQNKQTASGALFDSVSDRWGELFALTGYAWYLHDSPWMLAAVLVLGSSMMVSYTRARAESLNIKLTGGVMQRAERVTLCALGTLIAAWCNVDADSAATVTTIVGGTLLLCGVASTATALGRWVHAFRELSKRDHEALAAQPADDSAPHPLQAPLSAQPITSSHAYKASSAITGA